MRFSLQAVSATNTPMKPLLTLGTQFEPGVDEKHFCKPAGVTALPDRQVFIADGYCNGRVVRFNFDSGQYLASYDIVANNIGAKVVHAVAYDPTSRQAVVADRENGRVFGLDPFTGHQTFVTSPTVKCADPIGTSGAGDSTIYAVSTLSTSNFVPLAVALNRSGKAEPAALFPWSLA